MAHPLIWDAGVSGMHAFMPGCVLVVAQISAVEGCSLWVVDATTLSPLTTFLVSSAHNHNCKIDIEVQNHPSLRKRKVLRLLFFSCSKTHVGVRHSPVLRYPFGHNSHCREGAGLSFLDRGDPIW